LNRAGEVPAPEANQLDRVGGVKRLQRVWQVAHLTRCGVDLEYMQFGGDDLRPLIFLHSLEYPGAPDWGFCAEAAEAGFGVYAIRRPGFGRSTNGIALEDQAAIVDGFLAEAGLENVVIVAVGSANPVGHRLAVRSERVGFSIFANSVFNRDVMPEFQPAWFAEIMQQTLLSEAGARISLSALRRLGRQFGARWIYESCFQKSPGDIAFVRNHPEEAGAAWSIGSAIDYKTFQQELVGSLRSDPFLADGLFGNFKALAVSGDETTPSWKAGFESEAMRLALATHYLPEGDILAVYQSSGAMLKLLRTLPE
jgi:pimeloyl-ACP methyl ester carboxylesterase